MGKVSYASKDAVDVSFGIQEGLVEIAEITSRVHQYPPNSKTGVQGDPFPCVQIKFAKLEKDGSRTDTDVVPMEFPIGKMEKFHPGKANGPDDTEPEDLGTEVDTEGDSIYAVTDGTGLAKTCKWIRFTESLEQKGFKPEVLANGFLPELLGTKVEVKTVTLPKMPNSTSDKDPTALVVTRILHFPYDKNGKAPAGKKPASPASKPATQSAAASTGKSPASAPASPAAVNDDHATIATELVTDFCTANAGTEQERKKLQAHVQTLMMRNKRPIGMHKPVMELVKSEDWLTEQAGDESSTLYGKLAVDGANIMIAAAE